MNEKKENLIVVGTGSSAGGLEALQEFLSHLPSKADNIAVIVAQHLSPSYKSMLVDLLSRVTERKVIEIKNGDEIQAGFIYITPPDKDVIVNEGKLFLNKPQSAIGPKPNVNIFLHSLADDFGEQAVAVILSGTGSDGAKGISDIKRAGGITFAQSTQNAKYDGMPYAAIQTGDVDHIMTAESIGAELCKVISHSIQEESEQKNRDKNVKTRIIELLAEKTGTDFSHYKYNTLSRRIDKRIQNLKIVDESKYLDLIEKDNDEFRELFKLVLIGVTQFFRDEESFSALKIHLESYLADKNTGDPLRIWVPGCATGEEVYTIAIILAEIISKNAYHLNVQIFATDIDETAVSIGRKGIYNSDSMGGISEYIREKYFYSLDDEQYEVSKNIRQMVLFSKHDLTVDPPFLRLDMISCRNLLIYFNNELQKHVIPLFHYALHAQGIMFLGKSETIGNFGDLFISLDTKHKIYRRSIGKSLNSIHFPALSRKSHRRNSMNVKIPESHKKKQSLQDIIKDTFFNTFEHPYVIINNNWDLIEIKGDVSAYFNLPQGEMNANVSKLIRAKYQIELRSLLTTAVKERVLKKSSLKEVREHDASYYMRMVVIPLMYYEHDSQFYMLVFERIDIEIPDHPEPDDKDREVDTKKVRELEEELAIVKEHLQTYIEELETANEELQSLNEELQSSNEELQSTNEEMETSNEELQASNEELHAAYAELKETHKNLGEKETQLNTVKSNLDTILNNTVQSFVLIDQNYRIIAFNKVASDESEIINSRQMKEGDSFYNYVSESFRQQFNESVNEAFQGKSVQFETNHPVEGEARWFECNFIPVIDSDEHIYSIIITGLNITERKKVESEILELKERLELALEGGNIGWWDWDVPSGEVLFDERKAKMLGYDASEIENRVDAFTSMIHPDDYEKTMEAMRRHLQGKSDMYEVEYRIEKKDGTYCWFYDRGSIVRRTADGSPLRLSGLVFDMTEKKAQEQLLYQFKKITDKANYGKVLLTRKAEVHYINDYLKDLLEVSDEDKIHQLPMQRFISNESQKKFLGMLDKIYKEESVQSLELELVNQNGKRLMVLVNGFLIDNMMQHSSLAAMNMVDISVLKKTEKELQVYKNHLEQLVSVRTRELYDEIKVRKDAEKDLKKALKDKEMLLRELHHRVKNNLSTITSMVQLQQSKISDPEMNQMMNDISVRVRSMGTIHELLYVAEDISKIPMNDYISKLVQGIGESYHRPSVKYNVEVEMIDFNIETALTLGMILTELVTNAYKYAFPGNKSGIINVSLSKEGAYSDYEWLLKIEDNGIGTAEIDFEVPQSSFGLKIVDYLIKQVKAFIEKTSKDGTKYRIHFNELQYQDRV